MATGIQAFLKANMAVESERGTKPSPFTGAKLCLGTMTWNPAPKFFVPEEDHGKFSKNTRRIKTDESTPLQWEGPLTYEQSIFLLNMAVKGAVAGVEADEGYIWTYAPNYTSVNTPDTLSLEVGDDIEQYDVPFVFCKDLELSFAMNDVWKFRAGLLGRPMVHLADGFTAILPSTVEEVLGSKTRLWIDSSWANIGTTEIASTLISGNVRLNTGFVEAKYGSADLYFTTITEKKRSLELNLTCAFNSSVAAQLANFVGGTRKFFQIKSTGSIITSNTNRSLAIQLSGCIDSWDKLGERDGEDVVALKVTSEYDQTGTKEMAVVVANNVAAL